jgi:aminoglycoside N3'-acetyltransferase
MHRLKANEVQLTAENISRDLSRLGLSPGSKIMVHSSLSGLGFVLGGASTVIQALLDVIGSQGLLVMPCPPVTGATLKSLQSAKVFDPKTTPCTTGKICETFRHWPGVFRSLHPTHSVAAIGPEAKWLVKDHHLDSTPFGPNSPFARLLEIDASIVGIGLDVRWITLYHHFEDICDYFPVRVYSEERFQIPVLLEDGTHVLVATPRHDPTVAAVRLNNDYATLSLVDNALTQYGQIIRGVVGRGQAYMIKACNLIRTLERMLNEKGQTIYNLKLLRKIKPEAIIVRPGHIGFGKSGL